MTASLECCVKRRNSRMTALKLAMRLMPKMRLSTGSWRVTSPCSNRLAPHQTESMNWVMSCSGA